MSTLRRRLFGDTTPTNAPATPPQADSSATAEDVRLAPVSKIMSKKVPAQKHRKRRNGFVFFLGGVFGIVAAGFFANKNDLIDFPELSDMGFNNLMDALPAGMISDARDLAVS